MRSTGARGRSQPHPNLQGLVVTKLPKGTGPNGEVGRSGAPSPQLHLGVLSPLTSLNEFYLRHPENRNTKGSRLYCHLPRTGTGCPTARGSRGEWL